MNKKKKKEKKTSIIKIIGNILLFSIFIVGTLVVLNGGWDNFKLQSVKYWGFVSVINNPLLSNYDKDIKDAQSDKIIPRIDLNDLKSGGPSKDGIPSIDNPKFESIEDTPFDDDELVIGVFYNGEARAYPYGILNWHEILNDRYNNTPIVITLCPLCDTNPVFIGRVNGVDTTFGVSGKLYQSCLVMYDRLTNTLWSQPWGLGVIGENTNQELKRIVSHKTTLGKWKKLYLDTLVLSTDTGYNRDYFKYPYGTYYTDDNLIFSVRNQKQLKLHPKEIISYIWKHNDNINYNKFSGNSVQIVNSLLSEQKKQILRYGDEKITAKWDETLDTTRFFDENNIEIPSSTAFAFVYPAYFG